jgi:inosose dehydratase
MADAGYTGTDLGPVGYYDPDRLENMLKSLNLTLVAGNIFEKVHEPDQLDLIIEKTRASCTTLKKFGAKFFVIVPHTCPEKEATAGRPKDAPRLSDDRWAQMMDVIKKVAEVVKSYDICCMLHPHAGSWIEYEDEMERALADLPADLVALCLDTGHCTYAGMDPVEKFKKHAQRIPYMQLKDIDGAVLKKMQEQKGSFWDGVTAGIFCVLGQGVVDYPSLLRAMKDNGFSGYATIEQDFDNKIDDEERKLMYPANCSRQSVKYLRDLAYEIDEAPAAFAPKPRSALKRIPGVKEFHTFQRAPNHTVVDIFMREKGLEDDYFNEIEVWINLDMEDNRNDTNLAMNPQGSIPWFVLEDGRVIAETIAMCEYIEEVMPGSPLVGRDAAERATVRMWQRRMEEHYCYPAFYGHRFWTSSDACPVDHFMKDFFVDRLNERGGAKMIPAMWQDLCQWAKNRILWLERVKQEEKQKTGRTTLFIAGDFFSLVDIQVYTVLWFFAYAFPHPPQMILEELKGHVPWVQAWYDRCDARPSCAAAREDREKDLRQNKTEPKKHMERLSKRRKDC